MSDDMVERVARAIYDAAMRHTSSAGVRKRWPWGRATDQHDKYRAIARAAIEATREPTEEMWEAWRSNCRIGEHPMEEFTYFEGDFGNWLACHHRMIDAALVSERGAEE